MTIGCFEVTRHRRDTNLTTGVHKSLGVLCRWLYTAVVVVKVEVQSELASKGSLPGFDF